MPFAIRNWPQPPDPRSTCFCIRGFANARTPAYKWTVVTTDATGAWDEYNTIRLMTFRQENEFGCEWKYLREFFDAQPEPSFNQRESQFFTQPVLHPLDVGDLSIELGLQVTDTVDGVFVGAQRGSFFAVQPDPQSTFIFNMVQVPGTLPVGDIPNPMVIVPRPWDFEL